MHVNKEKYSPRLGLLQNWCPIRTVSSYLGFPFFYELVWATGAFPERSRRQLSDSMKLTHSLLAAILEYMGISRATFYRMYAIWLETGDVVRPVNGRRGRPRILHFSDVDYLKRLIQHRPNWFLDEMLYLLQTNRFVSLHYTTIHRELVRAGVSSKKIKKIASERNEAIRADFIRRMAQYAPEQLGFLDKVSKDERTSFRNRGRSFKGIRAVQKGVFVCGRHFSAEGLLSLNSIISCTVVDGSMTRARFLEYLEQSIVSHSLPGHLVVFFVTDFI